ncbi:response regulator transcription factor [Paraburkholderia rhizosphaerae]|uniref:response regulator transcription factor n=1 Tax=Paraburkholderia rhizosphaerae TaxID=480658 RepID=UPI001FBA81A5|nr:response regulator [Paraburkholderia rhizosphaerae]
MDTSHLVSIVDDDDAVRLATASLVRSFGWDVNDFASAEAYLSSGRIDETSFLISDIRMPGMSGIELHDCLLKQGHAPPTIFITAFPTAFLHAQTQAQGALALLEKPVDANVIAHWLTTALGSP